jgi:hypothetical protein
MEDMNLLFEKNGKKSPVGKTELFKNALEKIWCPEADSNHRHKDFQSFALPTELSGHISFF